MLIRFSLGEHVVHLCLSSSSDEHHLLPSFLGTVMRVGTQTGSVIIVRL